MKLNYSPIFHVAIVLIYIVVIEGFISISMAQETLRESQATRCQRVSSNVHYKVTSAWETTLSTIDTSEQLNKAFFIDALHGWIAGEHSLYQTETGGASWRKINLSVPSGFRISSMYFVDLLNGWVIVEKFDYSFDKRQLQLFRTNDGGKTWRLQLKLNKTFGGEIKFIDSKKGWLVADKSNESFYPPYYPLVLYTSNQGNSWKDVSVELVKKLPRNDISRFSQITDIVAESESVFAISDIRGKIIATNDGGRTWGEIESSCTKYQMPFGAIFKRKKDNALWMATGADSLEGYWGEVVEQQKDGSWIRYQIPEFTLTDALYISESNLFVAGAIITDSGTRIGAVLYSEDKGKNFTVVYQNKETTRMRSLAFDRENHIWATGDKGIILRIKMR